MALSARPGIDTSIVRNGESKKDNSPDQGKEAGEGISFPVGTGGRTEDNHLHLCTLADCRDNGKTIGEMFHVS